MRQVIINGVIHLGLFGNYNASIKGLLHKSLKTLTNFQVRMAD